MADSRVEKLAELLVNYSVAVKQGDKVAISGESPAEPLLKSIYVKVLRAGGLPFMITSLPGIDELFYGHASEEQLAYVPEPLRLIMDTFDVRISIGADDNTKALNHVDPAKIVTHERAATELMKTFMRRSSTGELRWTYAIFPTNAYAQDAEMGLNEYEDFVYNASLGDINDPVGYWRRFSDWQHKIVNWLKAKKSVHINTQETELKFSVEDRLFINCNGHENVPDGEVFTGPIENSMNGHVYFSYPAIYGGREVTGVRLWFENGSVVKATAEKNEDFLIQTLNTDEGARRVGEFAFGTNQFINKFTGQILFDEKINGSFHMALGASYPETGGKNESAIHWDMICDMRHGGEVRVDGELLCKNGEFTIPL